MKLNNNFIAGVLGIVFSSIVWLVSASFPVFELKGAGPEFYPRLMAFILAGLSFMLIYQGLKLEEEKKEPIEKNKLRQLLMVLVVVVIYFLFMKAIGYFITTFVMCTLVSMVLFGKLNKKLFFLSLTNSTVICSTIYVVFRIMLRAPLPQGLFF